MNVRKILLPCLALFCASGLIESRAQILLQWNTFGNAGTETTEASTFNNTNLSSSSLTLGAGVTAASNGNRFGGSGWFNAGNTNPSTLAEAIAGNDYIQFIVTPNSGASFTPSSFVFTWDRTATTGPSSVTLRSSADSFTSDLGSVTGMASGAITTSRTITISGLTNLSSATTFRLYGYAGTATTGTGGFDIGTNTVNVQLNGTAIPEPSTYAALFGSLALAGAAWRRRKQRATATPPAS
jgi:hypothetical protein